MFTVASKLISLRFTDSSDKICAELPNFGEESQVFSILFSSELKTGKSVELVSKIFPNRKIFLLLEEELKDNAIYITRKMPASSKYKKRMYPACCHSSENIDTHHLKISYYVNFLGT